MERWTDGEYYALTRALTVPEIERGLTKLFSNLAEYENRACAQLMRQVPADKDRAANHAARAACYESLLAEVRAQLERFQTGHAG